MWPLMESAKKLGATTRSRIKDPGNSNQSAHRLYMLWSWRKNDEVEDAVLYGDLRMALYQENVWGRKGAIQLWQKQSNFRPVPCIFYRQEMLPKQFVERQLSSKNYKWFTSAGRITTKVDWGKCRGSRGMWACWFSSLCGPRSVSNCGSKLMISFE